MQNSQILFYLTNALHVSDVTITHPQEHKTTVTTASGNQYTLLLSAAIVLWVAYATHDFLKPVPTLPRWQQTTVDCNGYQMLSLQLFVLLRMGDSVARNM
jgi:hypothetical protein